MSSIGILLFFAVIHFGMGNADFVDLKCKTENVGHYGQKSLLDCFIETSKNVADPQITVVIWKKREEVLLIFYKGNITTQLPGYSFAAPSWNHRNMNVSLLISNTTVQHQGGYTCEVIANGGPGGDEPTHTSLNVTAKYMEPAVIPNPDIITSNTSGNPAELGQGKKPDSNYKVVAPLVVIGSLITGLLMALLYYRCRSQRRLQVVRTGELEAQEAEHLKVIRTCQDDLA